MEKIISTLLMLVALIISLCMWGRPVRLRWGKAYGLKKKKQVTDTNGRITSADGLYLGIFLIFIIKDLINSSQLIVSIPSSVSMALNVTLLIFLALKLCSQKYTWKSLLGYIIFALLCLYTGLRMGDYYLIYSFLLMICLQKVNIRRVMRFQISFVTQVLLIHVICFFVLWIFDRSSIPVFYRSGVVRYAFYMVHPNKFSTYLTWVSLGWLFLRYETIRVRSMLLLTGISIFCYFFTGSRTSIIVVVITEILILLMKRKKTSEWLGKMISFVAHYGFACGLVLYWFIAVTYGRLGGTIQKIYDLIDTITNGRIFLAAYVSNTSGLSILGQSVTATGKFYWYGKWFDEVYLDSSYSQLLWGYGILYAIILCIFFYRVADKVTLKTQVFLTIYFLYGFFENYGLDAVVCFMPLLLWSEAYEKKPVLIAAGKPQKPRGRVPGKREVLRTRMLT